MPALLPGCRVSGRSATPRSTAPPAAERQEIVQIIDGARIEGFRRARTKLWLPRKQVLKPPFADNARMNEGKKKDDYRPTSPNDGQAEGPV